MFSRNNGVATIQTTSIKFYSYFDTIIVTFGVILLLDVLIELILSSDNPLDFQK